MRKTLTAAAFAMLATLLTISLPSCKGGEPDDPQTPGKYDGAEKLVTNYQFDYYGDIHGKGVENYFIFFTTGDVKFPEGTQTAIPESGSGLLVCTEINAASHDNLFPAAGTYPIVDEETPGTARAGMEQELYPGYKVYSGCIIQVVENGKITGTKFATSGSIEITGTAQNAKYYVDYLLADGTKKTFLFEGAMTVKDCTKK